MQTTSNVDTTRYSLQLQHMIHSECHKNLGKWGKSQKLKQLTNENDIANLLNL